MNKFWSLLLVLALACSAPTEYEPDTSSQITRNPDSDSGNPAGTDGPEEVQESNPNADLEDITRDFALLMESLGVPGAQLAIIRNEKLVYLRSFGLATLQGTPVDDTSLFRIGGISKPITLLGLSRLVQDGKLRVEDRVFGPGSILGNRYGAPPYRPEFNRITVKDLIRHRSGITDNPTDLMFLDPGLSHEDLFAELLNNRTLAFEPGTSYSYSNIGYSLLGRIIESVSGIPYEEYVFEEVLAPMGITSMRVSRDAFGERIPGEVKYYANWELPYPLNVTRMDAHGGWLASAYHLARLAVQSDGGGNFPDLLPPGAGLDYLSTGIWQHNGALPGTTALLRVSAGLSYVVLMNRGEENFQEVIQYIANFMNQKTLNRSQWPQVDYFKQL